MDNPMYIYIYAIWSSDIATENDEQEAFRTGKPAEELVDPATLASPQPAPRQL